MRRTVILVAPILMLATACFDSATGQLTPEGQIIARAAQHNDYIAQRVNHAILFTPEVMSDGDLLTDEEEASLLAYVTAAEAEPQYRRVWDAIAECESNSNWSINTGNGYYGGVQFALSSWRAVGGSGYPHRASKAEQIRRAEMLLDLQGWGAWPYCSRLLGLR